MKKEKEQFIQALLKAMRSYGYLFPQTEDEVELFYKTFGHKEAKLPESLKDASFLFKKKVRK